MPHVKAFTRNLRGDLLGGNCCGGRAPLALALGISSRQGGAIYGLYGAIVAGFLAALLGGTPSRVVDQGPMSVTVAAGVESRSNWRFSLAAGAAGDGGGVGVFEALMGFSNWEIHHTRSLFRCVRLSTLDSSS